MLKEYLKQKWIAHLHLLSPSAERVKSGWHQSYLISGSCIEAYQWPLCLLRLSSCCKGSTYKTPFAFVLSARKFSDLHSQLCKMQSALKSLL